MGVHKKKRKVDYKGNVKRILSVYRVQCSTTYTDLIILRDFLSLFGKPGSNLEKFKRRSYLAAFWMAHKTGKVYPVRRIQKMAFAINRIEYYCKMGGFEVDPAWC